jgi:hypothetical protein
MLLVACNVTGTVPPASSGLRIITEYIHPIILWIKTIL